MKSYTLAAALLAGGLALAGCAGQQANSAPEPKSQPQKGGGKASASKELTHKPEPTPTVPTLGHEYNKTDRYAVARMTALSYETDVPYPADRDGYETAALEARVCIDKLKTTADFGGEAIPISWQPWTLRFDGGFIIESAGGYIPEKLPGPMYPDGRQIREGECARGWIPFEVPKDAEPQRVTYMPGSTAYQLQWRFE